MAKILVLEKNLSSYNLILYPIEKIIFEIGQLSATSQFGRWVRMAHTPQIERWLKVVQFHFFNQVENFRKGGNKKTSSLILVGRWPKRPMLVHLGYPRPPPKVGDSYYFYFPCSKKLILYLIKRYF